MYGISFYYTKNYFSNGGCDINKKATSIFLVSHIGRKQQRRALVSKTSCSIFKTNLCKMKILATALAIVLSFALASVAKPK